MKNAITSNEYIDINKIQIYGYSVNTQTSAVALA